MLYPFYCVHFILLMMTFAINRYLMSIPEWMIYKSLQSCNASYMFLKCQSLV